MTFWSIMIGRRSIAATGHKQEGAIPVMAIRPLIFGVLFIAAFVGIILSIIWVDTSHPVHQPDPLSPTAPGPATPSGPVQ
ncbi:hypothetical protein CO651_17785 [Rhizobium phaseoli]|nr:hypothetical protein CO651_17785 [Rhizobium phaseoli]